MTAKQIHDVFWMFGEEVLPGKEGKKEKYQQKYVKLI